MDKMQFINIWLLSNFLPAGLALSHLSLPVGSRVDVTLCRGGTLGKVLHRVPGCHPKQLQSCWDDPAVPKLQGSQG